MVPLIDDGLEESRTRILAKLYENDLDIPLVLPPINGGECIDDDVHKENGTVWLSWPEPWSGIAVDHYEILINTEGIVYKTQSNQSSALIPGFDTGEEVEFFIRPVLLTGTVGEWGQIIKCSVT